MNLRYILILSILFTLLACRKDRATENVVERVGFSVNDNQILKNGETFNLKGVVYVPGYPGHLPWEIESSSNLDPRLRNSIRLDLAGIKEMNANTVRLWGAPQYCYEVLDSLGGLALLQTIWIDGEVNDFQDPDFKAQTKSYIRSVIDRVYAGFDRSPPIVAWIVGNELSRASIEKTDQAHPNLNQYQGRFIATDSNRSASEVFLAEMADYTKSYEEDNYGQASLVTYSNDIRTFNILETAFLDFISHNAYSYAVPYYRPFTNPGSTSATLFQGWVEQLKNKHPEIPLLITETGLSVSPNAQRMGPPNYGYGGNTIPDQSSGLVQNLIDIQTANRPIAGVCIHEYLDAWWKFGLQDSYSQDPDDIEEWFGLVELQVDGNWYRTEARLAYRNIKSFWEP